MHSGVKEIQTDFFTDPFECFQKIPGFLIFLLPCWAVFLHHYCFYTDNYYLQAEVNYLLSLTEKI